MPRKKKIDGVVSAEVVSPEVVEVFGETPPETPPEEPQVELEVVTYPDDTTPIGPRSVKVDLTDSDRLLMSEALVQFNLDLIQLENEKADLPGKIKACRSRVDEMSRTLRAGWEFRDVECFERFRGGAIEVVRADTLKIVETRAASTEERQVPLFSAVPETKVEEMERGVVVEEPIEPGDAPMDGLDLVTPTEEEYQTMGDAVIGSMTVEPMTLKEISDSACLDSVHVSKILKSYVKTGEVLKEGRKYRLCAMDQVGA